MQTQRKVVDNQEFLSAHFICTLFASAACPNFNIVLG